MIIILSILAITGIGIGGYFIYQVLTRNDNHDPKPPTSNINTNFFVETKVPPLLKPSENILTNDFITNNENVIYSVVKNSNNYLNLPKNSVTSNWNIRFDSLCGDIFVDYTTNKYYDNGVVQNNSRTITHKISGFKNNELKIDILSNSNNQFIQGNEVAFNAKITDSNNSQIQI